MRHELKRVVRDLKTCLTAAFCAAGGARLLRALSRKLFPGCVRVLYCHDVRAPDPNRGVNGTTLRCLDAVELERRLLHVKRHYGFVSMGQALGRLREEGTPDGIRVLLTFDDGYRSFLDSVYPILRRHEIPAVLLVTSGAVGGRGLWSDLARDAVERAAARELVLPLSGRKLALESSAARAAAAEALVAELKRVPDAHRRQVLRELCPRGGGLSEHERRMLTWDELGTLARDPLVTLGAHTVTHAILSRLSDSQACAEIVVARDEIERRLGVPIAVSSYPNGGRDDFTETHERVVADAGFSAAFSTVSGLAAPGSNPYAIPRSCLTAEPWPRFVLRMAGLDDCLGLVARALRRLWPGGSDSERRAAVGAEWLPSLAREPRDG